MNTDDRCHTMIDIETLSRHSNATILSIGVVLFSFDLIKEPGPFQL